MTTIDREHPCYDALTPSQQRRARMGGIDVDTDAPTISKTVVLIDLSSVAHPLFHVHQNDADSNSTSTHIVEAVRRYAHGQPHVAICCDSGKSFRKDIDATYKAQRAERDPALYTQIARAIDTLKADGFPVWAVPGFEADDLIASAVVASQHKGLEVLIVSSDKDLLQLVSPRVSAKSVATGVVMTVEGVIEKFGVAPENMRDYLSLVGDASDNITGAKGIGPKRASELLERFGTLDELYADMRQSKPTELKLLGLTPALVASLEEFDARRATVRELITLKTDVPVPFDEVFAERVPQSVAEFNPEADYEEEPMPEETSAVVDGVIEAAPTTVATEDDGKPVTASAGPDRPAAPLVVVPKADLVPIDYERALDPRDLKDARIIAKDLFESRMFSGYGSPQAVLSTVMLGRELGLPAMASLRGVHNIEGRHGLSAQTMVALVLKSGFAEYFEPLEFDEEHATYVTHRKGARKEQTVTHTIEMARTAFFAARDDKAKAEASWLKSNWSKSPVDMLVARASSRLCRLVYPDVVGGLYTPEELREIRDAEAVA